MVANVAFLDRSLFQVRPVSFRPLAKQPMLRYDQNRLAKSVMEETVDIGYVSVGAAFLAGFLSFISPCLLPLVPIYLSYLGGSTVAENGQSRRLTTLAHAAFFVLGFTIVYTAVGASVGLVGDVLSTHMPLLLKIAGLLIIVLGLQLIGIIHIPLLSGEKRIELGGRPATGYPSSLLLGLVFGFAWTPCVGPTLVAISVLASATETVGQGAFLLAVYSAGLALPFLIAAAAVDAIGNQLRRLNRYLPVVSMVSGLFLIVVGVLVFADRLQQIAGLTSSLGLSN